MRLTPLALLTLAVAVLLGALGGPATAAAQDVPAPTPTEASYLAATKPFRDKFGAYQEQLAAQQRAASAGQIDAIALADLGDLTRELFAAQQAFEGAVPPVRLDQYDRTIKLALERTYDGTVLLLRAQRTESEPDRAALIREAGIQSVSGSRLLQEGTDLLRALIPGTAL